MKIIDKQIMEEGVKSNVFYQKFGINNAHLNFSKRLPAQKISLNLSVANNFWIQ